MKRYLVWVVLVCFAAIMIHAYAQGHDAARPCPVCQLWWGILTIPIIIPLFACYHFFPLDSSPNAVKTLLTLLPFRRAPPV